MAPTPIFVDLPPYEGINKTFNYNNENTKGKKGGLELLNVIETALQEFARNKSSIKTSLKDFLKSFFENDKVNATFLRTNILSENSYTF